MSQKHVYEGHKSRIFSLALASSPDGGRIAASGSHDRTVKVWCLNTNRLLRSIDYTDFVWRVFLVTSSSGKLLVVAFISAEDKIVISDVNTGETERVLYGRLLFAGLIPTYPSPIVIVATGDEDISIVDVQTGSACRLILGGFGRVFRAVVSDPSAILVFTTWNHQNRRSTIQTYELNEDKKEDCSHLSSRIDGNTQSSDKTIIMFEGDSKDGVSSLAVSKSKMPFICSGHYDFFIRVWDLIERKLMFTLKGHTDWVVSVAVWKGSERLAVSGSSDGTIKIWDLRTGDIVTTCEGHLRDVWSVTVTEGPKPLIVSASVDKTIRTWDINPFLNDLKWERRRNFCTFVYCCGLLDRIISKNVSISEDLQDKNEGSNVHCIEYSSELMHDKSNKDDKGIADLGVMIDVINPSDTSNLKIEKVSASHCVAKSNPQSDNVNHNIVISDYLTEMKKLDITKVTDTVEKRDDMFDMNDKEFTYENEFDCNECKEIQYKKTCSDNSPSIASVLSEVSPKSFLEMVFQSIHLCTEIASYI